MTNCFILTMVLGAKRKTTMPKEENESDTKNETLFNSIIKQKLTEVKMH